MIPQAKTSKELPALGLSSSRLLSPPLAHHGASLGQTDHNRKAWQPR